MERSTMFLHSLLVLLVAIQMTLACQCEPLTLGKAMCSSTTVVLARVSGGKPHSLQGVAYTRYMIDLTHVFQVEERKLSLNNGRGSLLFPQEVSDCGGMLQDGVDYILVGSVDSNGELVSGRCYHFVPYEYIAYDRHSTSILLGEVDCKDV